MHLRDLATPAAVVVVALSSACRPAPPRAPSAATAARATEARAGEPSRAALPGLESAGLEPPTPVAAAGTEPSADPMADPVAAPSTQPNAESASQVAVGDAQPAAQPAALRYAALADFERGGVQLEITRRVPTGPLPKSVEVSPDGTQIWVCNFGQVNADNIWVYDAQSLERQAVINFAGNAVETIWSPDQSKVYVSNFKRAVVEVIDAKSFKVESEIKVGFNPKIMVATPDGKYLYVANWSSNDVTIVDLARGEKVRRLKTGRHPRGMALHSDGRLFVNAMFSHQIHVFDDPRAENPPSQAHDSCKYPRHSILSPDETRLYVTCSGADKVYWYDPETMRRRGWAKVGDNPRSMAMTDDGRFFAVADFDSSTVSLVDVAAGTFDTFELSGAKKVVGVAVAPGPELVVFATSWLTGELLELRPKGDPAPSEAP